MKARVAPGLQNPASRPGTAGHHHGKKGPPSRLAASTNTPRISAVRSMRIMVGPSSFTPERQEIGRRVGNLERAVQEQKTIGAAREPILHECIVGARAGVAALAAGINAPGL